MTQIFTNEGLGLHGSSLGLGSFGPNGAAALGQGGESVYVNVANGNLVLRQSDGFLADVGFGLDLFQTYNSLGESASNWRFNLQSRLDLVGSVNTAGSSVTRTDEDGHRSRYVFDAQKQCYLPETGGTARLTFNQNEWAYSEGNQKTTSHYNTDGLLIKMTDKDGHHIDFTYQNGLLIQICDSSNKQKVTWSFRSGLLQDVTTSSDGQTIHHIHYEYDQQNRLHRVSRDLGDGKTFWITYDYAGDSNRISDLKQSDGTALHIDYDAQGRVKQLVDGEGQVSLYEYGSGKTTVTNALGESWTYLYDEQNRLTGIDGPQNYRIRYQYDGKELSTIIKGNEIWKFSYNALGDCIRLEEPSGQITQRVFDQSHHLLLETHYQAFDGNHHPVKPLTTRYVYDGRGHLRFVIAADGTVTEKRYDEQGQLISTRCDLRTAYDLSLLAEDQILSQETMLVWVAKQNATDISLIDYQYDWRGQLTEEIHYAQIDANGQGIVSGSISTRCRYDAAGRLVEKSTPMEGAWSTTYYLYDDLGRLIQTLDNQQHSQRFEYDDVHQRIIQTDANGLQTIKTYDRNGFLISIAKLDSKQSYGTTTFQYNAAGHLVIETGVDGLSQYFFYDQQGQLQARVNAQGQLTTYVYNDNNLLLQTYRYAQPVSTHGWLKQLPNLKDITPAKNEKDSVSQTVYNQFNQIAYQINAQGAVIAYEYNAEGQVIASTAYACKLESYDPNVLLSFDAIHIQINPADRHAFYYYDNRGRLEAKVNGEGFAVAYRYDRQDHLVETYQYYNSIQQVHTGVWTQDKPTKNAGKDIQTYSLYDGRGLKVADIDGEGYLTEYCYDSNGLLKSSTAYAQPIAKGTVFDEETTVEHIRPAAHNNDHQTQYTYNDLGLLILEKNQSGLVITYVYDEMNQLLKKTRTDEKIHQARAQTYRYDALGRVIQSLDELGCALLNKDNLTTEEIDTIWQNHSLSLTYDKAGLLLTKTNALKQSTHFFYDETRQLRYTINADGAVVETRYTIFGQLESSKKYSAYLKLNFNELTTTDIQSHLEKLQNETLDELTRYEYNSLGQMIAKRIGAKGLVSSQFNVFGELESTTQRINAQKSRVNAFYYDRRGLLIQSVDDVGGKTITSSTRYDAFAQIIESTDGRLNSMHFGFNKRGEQILIQNASNQFKKMSYDAFGRIVSETDFTGTKKVKVFSYDDRNNQLIMKNPQTNSSVVTEFNAFGDKITIQDANGFSTHFQYDSKGQLIRIDSPEHAFKAYHYDALGQLTWQMDAGGQATEFTYDAQGHLLSKTIDPQGLRLSTSYQYDAMGRQLKIIDAEGKIKQLVYGNSGNLVQSIDDPEGLHLLTQFTYDDRGLLLRQTEFNPQGHSKITAYEWDGLGRQIAKITDPDGLKITVTMEYDANDNVICQTDANQHATRFVYDVNDRCQFQINARGAVTEHRYDINGNEINTISYANPITIQSEYTSEKIKLSLKESSQDHQQFRSFNSEGKLILSYDGLGFVSETIYDGNNNVIETRQYAEPVSLESLKKGDRPLPVNADIRYQHFIYDGLNQLRFKCDNKGNVTESQYNGSGQLLQRTQYAQRIDWQDGESKTLNNLMQKLKPDVTADQSIHYVYDKAGRMTCEVSAKGVAKSYEYDALDHVIASRQYANTIAIGTLRSDQPFELVKSPQDRMNHFVYDAAGREQYRISSEGRVIERRYDAFGNVIAEMTHAKHIQLSEYDATSLANALKTLTDETRQTTYEYDAVGRLLTQTNAKGASTQYRYDSEGNVMTRLDANQALWTYRYDEANQLIETTSPLTLITTAQGQEKRAIITRNTYDNFGNLIAVVRDAEGSKQALFYEYDANNQKTKTIYPNVSINSASKSLSNSRQETTQTLVEEIKYNAFGEVIASSDKAGNWKHFAYDRQGLLLYSVNSQGGLTQFEYDAFGRVIEKTSYANAIHLAKNKEYSTENIEKARHASEQDRHEYTDYDLDNHVIEVRRDAVLFYNAKTAHYDINLQPTNRITYNTFGEVIKTAVRRNESDWTESYFYYDPDGHKSASIDAEGYLTAFKQNTYGEVESMTEYAYAATQWDIESYSPTQTSANDRTVTFAYDALGQVTSKTLKQVSHQRLTANSQAVETLVNDLTTRYEYDALGHVVVTTDAQGNTAYCYYDAMGQLIAKVAPQTQAGRGATTYSYDALGHLVETRRWAQGVLAANAEDFQLKGASQQDQITSHVYDSQGQLIADIDGLKHRINYSYDANGNLARSWQELSQVDGSRFIQDKRYSYDSENHLLQTATFKINGDLKTEDAQYNVFGELVGKGIDGLFNTHVDYDKLGRVWRSNTQGYYQIFVYDLQDNVNQIVTSTSNFRDQSDENGVDLSDKRYENAISFNLDEWRYDLQRQDNVYDGLGHLLSQSKHFTVNNRNDLHLEHIDQKQTVDRWGNVLCFTNPRGLQTHYEYNAFNQVMRQELPEVRAVDEHGVGRVIKPVQWYAYDELGRTIAMIDANGHLVSKVYDAAGRVTQETDAKGHVRHKQYNLLDQLDTASNELGALTHYTYDQANRLVAVDTPKTHQRYQYNEAGQLIKQTNGAQEESTFWYDSLGNQIKRSDARGHATFYEFDDAGHKTKETDANGRSQSWTYTKEGRIEQHRDLGGHVTTYDYNSNGLLLSERSTTGKQLKFHYRGDGELIQYADESLNEVVNYSYDAEGHLVSKEAGRGGDYKDGWLRETDYYQYDALGRLVQVRRRNPDDTDKRFPDKDKALLSINYEYDAVGNIRHTQVSANYTGYEQVNSDDYFLYDENDRMIINKGQLVNGQISLTSKQGSQLVYDAAGNIQDATKYENGSLQNYHYQYNQDNQLELIQKNGRSLQAKRYDEAGRVVQDNAFDEHGAVSQKNTFIYDKGFLVAQSTKNQWDVEVSKTNYRYDEVGNMTELNLRVNGQGGSAGYNLSHRYEYALWDAYLQNQDQASLTFDQQATTYGNSTRLYDINGQLKDAVDSQVDGSGKSNTTHYWNSSVEGIRARDDKEGQTSYLTVAGKTIADLRLDRQGKQHLNVYGGFTPSGSPEKAEGGTHYSWQKTGAMQTASGFLERSTGDIADGTLPEAPQDNLGAYTLQAGDTLENVALQVYGDSSLWYLLADANGISDRNAQASNNGPLHIGQRINLPAIASSQHQTHATRKVMNANQMIGNTSATTPLPPPPPPLPSKHHGFFSKIVVAVVAMVATVLTAGAIGALAGIAGGYSALFSTGLGVLSGTGAGASLGLGTAMGASLAAGFVGSVAGQGAAKVLGIQDGIDLKSALISGLVTAATAGLTRGLNNTAGYQQMMGAMQNETISKAFNISSAVEMMEINATSQGLNGLFNKSKHFDWEELGLAGLTGGLLASGASKKIDSALNTLDQDTGRLGAALKDLTSAGINSLTGKNFDAMQVLTDHVGNSLASELVSIKATVEFKIIENKMLARELEDSSLGSSSKEFIYSLFSEDVSQILRDESIQINSNLGLNSNFLESTTLSDFEKSVYWDETHKDKILNKKSPDQIDFHKPINYDAIINSSAKEIWDIRAFYGTKIPGSKVGKIDGIEDFVSFSKPEWDKLKSTEISKNLDDIQHFVSLAHKKYPNVSVELINAVIAHESKGAWNAISKTGALGVMQLTSQNYYQGKNANFNPFRMDKSIEYGVGMLSEYIDKFGAGKNGINKALAAYNQGYGHVSGVVKNHPNDWINHIHHDGKTYINKIDEAFNNKLHIPGYFGERR